MMETSDSSSDDSLSLEEQLHLDTLSALAATKIAAKLKDKRKTVLKSKVDSVAIGSDSDDGRSHPTHQQTSEDEAIQDDVNRATKYGDKDENAERIQLASSLQCNIQSNNCYVTFDWQRNLQSMVSDSKTNQGRKDPEEEVMKKSVITDDFERRETIPPYEESLRQMKKKRKLEREKTKGKSWFHMPAPEMTDERKHDLSILQMRGALDPKRFYKGNDIKALPRYFQFGEVVETPADFYHARVPKKQRKATIVDELLADVETRKYNKRKYTEIQEIKRKCLGPYRHMKRLKKKKH